MLEGYGGATRIFPIVGDPIAQVKSPAKLTRAFAAVGFDGIVVPFHVSPDDVAAFFRTMAQARNVDGMLATVPHKFAAFAFATRASDRAAALGAANILRRGADGAFEADMLDGLSMVQGLGEAGAVVAGRRALLVGAGGAGGAIGLALLDAGASQLAVHDTDAGRRDALLAKLATRHPGRAVAGSADPGGFDVVINATPSGMQPDDEPPVLLDRLDAAMAVGDVVTAPEATPLIAAARRLGCRHCTGIGMVEASLPLMRDFFLQARGA